jgi:carbamoylphosphate synthase small subunit
MYSRRQANWRGPTCMYNTLLPRAVRVGGMDKRALVQALRERGVQLNQAAEALFENHRFTALCQSKVIEIAIVVRC